MTNVHIAKPKHSNHVTVNSMYKNNNSIITKDDTGAYLTLKFKQEDRYKFKYTNTSTNPTNLLRNSATGDGWDYTTFDPTTRTFTKETTKEGPDEASRTSIWAVSAEYLMFDLNEYYTISFYIKSNGYVSDTNLFIVDKTLHNIKAWMGSSFVTLTTDWQKVTKTFRYTSFDVDNPPTGFHVRIDNMGTTTSGTNAILYVKDVKLEKGTVATDWTPTLEEVEESLTSGSAASRIAAATEANATILSKTLFNNKYIYGWTLHNQDTFDYQNILNNFRLVGKYENGIDAVNKNYLYSDTESIAPRPFEHEYTSHSEVINFDNIKTKLTDAPINCSAKPNDLLFLCVTEYGENQTYESQINYDVVSGSITISYSGYENNVPIPCGIAPRYTVIPIFDKNIFVDIAVNSAVECVNKRKHERDSILYDMLKIKAIEYSLKSGDFGTAIDFWKAFILAQDIEYDECFKEEARYERDKCDCSYIVNYD